MWHVSYMKSKGEKFMNKVLKSVLCSTMALGLAACSSGTAGSTAGTTSSSSVLKVAIGGESNYPDAAIASDSITGSVTMLTSTVLYRLTSSGDIEPAAATGYDVSDDGLTYTFHLREGLKWSDGTDLTAKDFEYGVKRSLGMSVADAGFNTYISNYLKNGDKYNESNSVSEMTDLGVEATDDTTLVFTLQKPCDYFPCLTTLGVYSPAKEGDYTEHEYTWADDTSIPVSGPYKIKSIDRATEIVFEKNEYWYDADNVTTDEIDYEVITDTSAQLMAYENGEVDFATSLDTSVIKQYEGNDELVMPGGVINYYVELYTDEGTTCEALQDADVRKAIQIGVNREEICNALDAGELYVPLYGFVPEGLPGSEDGSDFRTEGGNLITEDLDEAKKIMESKGYTDDNPLEIEYYYNDSTIHSTVAQVLQQQLAKIHINLTLKTGEIRTFFDDRTNGNFQAARNAYSADYMDVSNYLSLWTYDTQSTKITSDEHYDELYYAAQASTDHDERYKLLHEAEEYFIEEMNYNIPLFQYGSFYLLRSGITGIEFTPQGSADLTYVKLS